ncbi:NADH-quinone oxidoreductase subunit H [Fodinisporobacter ferrooxydans]|uniref:NADH-quinone oxidoreductase subunit H n=1 Tax=Fodinisporobacter ferrooxydans TaxID=2901836 RepID=A0ABY4CH82_9BACL|nr:NADH-quinone oxidoreductase subunit H [Alicyclobacillaceae bacterium MYW30-H2]
MSVYYGLLQTCFLLLFAPLLHGIIRKTKALLQGRIGPSLFQSYHDLRKYMCKDSMVSEHASWIFSITPYVCFGLMTAATTLIPLLSANSWFSMTGDFILIVYMFGLSRIFTALAGMDTGGSFGGMGASRDMFLSGLAEPVLFITFVAIAWPMKTTNLSHVVGYLSDHGVSFVAPSYWMIVLAFFLILLTETGRLPIDNPDTHLELTMIHEGMLLEYSGKQLGLMLWSAWLKQVLLFALFLDFCFPYGIIAVLTPFSFLLAIGSFAIKTIVLGVIVAFVEMSYAKMRLFKVPQMLTAAFFIAIFAVVSEFWR